jgi:hypothetical protein
MDTTINNRRLMMIKTTDGKDAKVGNHYYTVDGHEVMLNDGVRLESGEYKYLVEPYYEGTGMDVKCYGGEPVEINYPFEIYGDETMVNKLFEKPPSPKLDRTYVAHESEVKEIKIELSRLREELKTRTGYNQDLNDKLSVSKSQLDACMRACSTMIEQRDLLNSDVARLEAIKREMSDLENLKKSLSDSDRKMIYLIKRDEKLTCLENGGVDNWEWFEKSLEGYNEE